MPVMSREEKKELTSKMKFLYDKGYTFDEDCEYGFSLRNKNIRVAVYSGRYTDAPDILVRFLAENEIFQIGWMSFMMDKERNINTEDVLATLFYFLDFIEKNYEKIIDIEFCREKSEEIDTYIKENFPPLPFDAYYVNPSKKRKE